MGGGSAVLRAERILFFPQSVAPVPVWQMTLGENQGNEVGIARAQEKGHKANNVGSVQEEMGTAGAAGQTQAPGVWESTGDPRAGSAGGEGAQAQGWRNTKGAGKGHA